jgi:UDP:flavonoid glycosyltransferase YjiC (YdhE family)
VARFLVSTHPITGHVLPGIPIVAELVRRGHDVHWYVGAKFRAKAERAGATFEPYGRALDYDDADYDAAFPERARLSGLRQVTYDFRKVFVEQVEGQHRDITAILERFPADVTLGDTATCAPRHRRPSRCARPSAPCSTNRPIARPPAGSPQSSPRTTRPPRVPTCWNDWPPPGAPSSTEEVRRLSEGWSAGPEVQPPRI